MNNSSIYFEGEIINGKIWNGSIYNFNNIIISKIKNGNGILKIFDKNEKLRFEGQYINGIRNGKEYDNEGRLIFIGDYLYGKKWNGIIKEYNNGKLKFESIYINGQI